MIGRAASPTPGFPADSSNRRPARTTTPQNDRYDHDASYYAMLMEHGNETRRQNEAVRYYSAAVRHGAQLARQLHAGGSASRLAISFHAGEPRWAVI